MSALAEKQKPDILEEEDKPFEEAVGSESEIPERDVNEIERRLKIARGMQNIVLKDKGYWLLIMCIVLAVGTYVLDCVFVNKGLQSSALMTGFFELLKFIITILVGFIFAKTIDN